jgi:hypothetical protein
VLVVAHVPLDLSDAKTIRYFIERTAGNAQEPAAATSAR